MSKLVDCFDRFSVPKMQDTMLTRPVPAPSSITFFSARLNLSRLVSKKWHSTIACRESKFIVQWQGSPFKGHTEAKEGRKKDKPRARVLPRTDPWILWFGSPGQKTRILPTSLVQSLRGGNAETWWLQPALHPQHHLFRHLQKITLNTYT